MNLTRFPPLHKSGKWRQFFYGILASMSMVFILVNFSWFDAELRELTSDQSPIPMTINQSSLVAVMASIGSIVSLLFVGYTVDVFGRKTIILVSAALQISTWVAIYYTHSVYLLILIRFLQGLIMGAVVSALPVYLCEISETTTRGGVGVFHTIGWNMGIFVESTLAPFTPYKTLLIVNCFIPAIFICIFYFVKESPIYLVKKGKMEEAEESLKSFRDAGSSVQEELIKIKEAIAEEKKNRGSWKDLFGTRKGLRGLTITAVLAVASFGGGAMTIPLFSNEMFMALGAVDQLQAKTMTLILGVLTLSASILSLLIFDKIGRKKILVSAMVIAVVTASLPFFYCLLDETLGLKNRIFGIMSTICLLVYGPVISAGVVTVSSIYRGELFSSSVRSFASSLLTALTSIISVAFAATFLPLSTAGLMYVSFFSFAALNLLALVFTIFWVPETKGKELQEIQDML